MNAVVYLMGFLLFGMLLRRLFERGRKLAELRARIAELEAELAALKGQPAPVN